MQSRWSFEGLKGNTGGPISCMKHAMGSKERGSPGWCVCRHRACIVIMRVRACVRACVLCFRGGGPLQTLCPGHPSLHRLDDWPAA
jgi:hypothetical protein